jgi:hypothetical protein
VFAAVASSLFVTCAERKRRIKKRTQQRLVGVRSRRKPSTLRLTCAGKLVELGEFDPSDAVSYYPQDREAGYILLCTAKARSNLRIRTHMQTEMRAHRKKMGLPAPYA